MAISSPLAEPTYTTPSTTATDDSIESPASYVHRSCSVSGGRAAAMPVSRWLPRNCAQLEDDCADAAATVAATTRAGLKACFTSFLHSPTARRADCGCSGTTSHG